MGYVRNASSTGSVVSNDSRGSTKKTGNANGRTYSTGQKVAIAIPLVILGAIAAPFLAKGAIIGAVLLGIGVALSATVRYAVKSLNIPKKPLSKLEELNKYVKEVGQGNTNGQDPHGQRLRRNIASNLNNLNKLMKEAKIDPVTQRVLRKIANF